MFTPAATNGLPLASGASAERAPCLLAAWPLRTPGVVHALAEAGSAEGRRTLHRLAEIGFMPGEPVEVIARSGGRGGPMAVRVGCSTFALRAHEAALLQVRHPS